MARPTPEYTIENIEEIGAFAFPSLTNDEVFELGLVAIEVIREWNLSLAVDIVIGDDLIFRAKLKDTGAKNNEWLAGKALVAKQFGEPSLLVKLRRNEPGGENADLDPGAKLAGGSIPLWIDGSVVGTLTMSGEPDATDHEAAVETIERYLLQLPQ